MKYIGAHVSIGGGVQNAPLNAQALGASAFALFTKNQRQWKAKPLSPRAIEDFRANCAAAGFDTRHILPHDSYLINLSHPQAEELEQSRTAFLDEFRRCEQLGLLYLNFHPGAHLNRMTESQSLARIAESINRTLEQTSGVTAVIENTAGQGSSVGYRFEHLAEIIARIEDKHRIGICLDTCHTYSAGYDIRSADGYEETMRTFDRIVGLHYLKAIHLNDSKKVAGSRVDRHENIGRGTLGLETFRLMMQDDRLDHLPIIMETPEESLWAEDIRLLKRMAAKDEG
jgi:deoxyribonuclease IV